MLPNPKLRTTLALGLPLLLADCVTKRVAVAGLLPHQPEPLLGDVVRLTLAYNADAALGLSLGPWSRWGFALLAVAISAALLAMLRRTGPAERLRAAAIGGILAGALGNLFDRLRWDRGVVDFIDIGIGTTRFWTFNLADLAVTGGAVLLLVTLARADSPSPNPPSQPDS